MKKLQIADLTPEILEEVRKLEDAKAVVEFFAEKGFDVSEKTAGIILEESKKDNAELSEEALANVTGGCGGGGKSTHS